MGVDAVGQGRNIVNLTIQVQRALHFFIERHQFFIPDGPVNASASTGVRLEIVVGPTQQHAAEHMGAPAALAAADPDEGRVRRGRIGVLAIVDKQMPLPGIEERSTCLNALPQNERLGPFPEIDVGLSRRRSRVEVGIAKLRPGFQLHDVEPLGGEFLRCEDTRCA